MEQDRGVPEVSLRAWWAQLRAELKPALVLMRREIKDTLRDWRILAPILLLVTVFPFLANTAAAEGLSFVNQYGANLLIERMFPFLMLVVGFFPSTFSLVIALETFVGEKERRSLEPLLATPLTDLQLYIGKTLAAIIPPVIASYIGMIFYTLLLGFTIGWWPTVSLFFVAFVLSTAQALVMVSAAVIVSAQSTSVRAANLVASFIIIPMTLLLQAEAGLLLFNNFVGLWLIALALLVVTILFMRMGIALFNRERLLGQEIDQLNFTKGLRAFWAGFWPQNGLWHLYRYEVPHVLRLLRPHLVFTILVALGGGALIGLWGAQRFPFPSGAMDFSQYADLETFSEAVEASGLLSGFSTWAIWGHNVRSLFTATLLGFLSIGVVAVLLLAAPIAIIAYLVPQLGGIGINPWLLLATGVLPHGIFEIAAALLVTAYALRLGTVLLRPPEKDGGMMDLARDLGQYCKLFLSVALPLLLLAAWIEAEVSSRLMISFLGSL
ncbi:MAG: stage II sporulation protein M [Anaerolineae bacterium]|nr:stage II sporulation protein M [Anaerolineae bacterium]